MIQFTCPCGKALHAREDYIGQTTRCPQCGRELAIPAEQGVQAQLAAPPLPPRDRRDEAPRYGPRRGPDRAWADRPRPPATSGMAVTSMILGILSLFCSLLTAIPALILGGLGLRAISRSEGKLQGKGLAVTGLVTGGVGLLLFIPVLLFIIMPVVQLTRERQSKLDAESNLHQVGYALLDYSNETGALPSAALCDPNGKPLLSWRVAILPYISQNNLYNQFNLNEAWDSPHNFPLVAKMPKVYALPGDSSAPVGNTYFRVFVGNGAAFDDPTTRRVPPRDDFNAPGDVPPPDDGAGFTRGVRLSDVLDGTSNTILAVEAANSVPWTKPDELPYSQSGPLPALGGHFSNGFCVLMADGTYRFLSKDIHQANLRAAITRNGGEYLDLYQWEK